MLPRHFALFFALLLITRPMVAAELLDDDDDKPPSAATTANQNAGRYFFGLLDHRSSYGKDFFPDPFLGPEFDAEKQLDFDYLHAEKKGIRDDEIDAGFQWNIIGQLTISGEFGWDSEHQQNLHGGAEGENLDGGSESGLENVDLAVYHPIFQYVSGNGQFDYSAVVRLDVGIPTRGSPSSQDVLLTPYIGQLLRLGDHVSIEGWAGTQITIAPHPADEFIYGASFGYTLFHNQFPVPGTEKFVPMFELDGQKPMSGVARESLFGVAGFEVAFKSIGEAQPQIEIGYEFPIDQGAREQTRWGIVVQMFLEF
jgi:hypothetical protein